jgi:hypothetical protein
VFVLLGNEEEREMRGRGNGRPLLFFSSSFFFVSSFCLALLLFSVSLFFFVSPESRSLFYPTVDSG